DGSSHRSAGMLHQGFARDAGRDGTPIRLAHLRVGENFQHQFQDILPMIDDEALLLKRVHFQPKISSLPMRAGGNDPKICLLISQCAYSLVNVWLAGRHQVLPKHANLLDIVTFPAFWEVGTDPAIRWRDPAMAGRPRDTACFRAAKGEWDEKKTSGPKTPQARRSKGGSAGGRTSRHYGDGSQGVRASEGTHGTLSRRRVRRRFSAESEDRDRARRRHGRQGGRNDKARRADRPHWRWKDFRLQDRGSHSHPNRGIGAGCDLMKRGQVRRWVRTPKDKGNCI